VKRATTREEDAREQSWGTVVVEERVEETRRKKG